MREAGFQAWLEERRWNGKPLSAKAIYSRLRRVARVERSLSALGFPADDLDAVHARGAFPELRSKLKALIDGAPDGTRPPPSLVPQASDPGGQLRNLYAALRQYEQFAAGLDPNAHAELANEETKVRAHEQDGDEVGDATVWFVTARNGQADGLQHFVSSDEWRLLRDIGGKMNQLVREMRPDDVIVLRDYFHQQHGLPFDAKGRRVSAIRIRAMGVVTEQRDDGLSVGVDWTVLPDPRVWYFYTNNDPVWRLPLNNELAARLALFTLNGEPQDYDWFLARWYGGHAGWAAEERRPLSPPTNLILHGPPGTGKTYATAAEAVRLCGEVVPEDRAALMERYRELVKDERIAFVTFHQSMAYEDFVEGLRPSSITESGEALLGGFRLAPEAGVFQRIAERAETLGAAGPARGFALGDRAVFKMSLGEAANPDEDYVYDEAIEGGYVLLGDGGDVDWSDPALETKEAMIEAHAARHPEAARLSPLSGRIEFAHALRSRAKLGDLVIVSKGNLQFRAIGEVTGGFEKQDRAGRDDYRWRRAVRWLWRDDEGKPYDLINNKRFSQRTIYELSRRELKADAIERLVNGGANAHAPGTRPFVLIIDEINRANISKVFGELITLLEPDKRIGMVNELKVTLPYSKKEFGVPANLHIVGTMNTADRSIALIDKALRRRFRFKEMMPDPDLPELIEAGERAGVDLSALLRTINDRIEWLLDREHRIGHAWLLGCDTRQKLDAAMRERIIPLIAEYFFEHWGKVADVLGGRDDNPFLQRIELKRPPGYGDEERRYRWRVREEFAADAYERALAGG